jgi:hypothetical protein
MAAATRGLADVWVLRPAVADVLQDIAPADLLFGFVLHGSAVLEHAGEHPLEACDAFVIPPGQPWGLRAASPDLELLQVALPAKA